MNSSVINNLVKTLNLKEKQIVAVLDMLKEGATIPFIARYRKEKTGSLDEEQIREIEKTYKYQTNLMEKKEDVIRLIEEKGMLTSELKQQIMEALKLSEVEDLYRPYKEKKRTKATEAIKMGLEPLAKKIMAFPTTGSLKELCKGFDMDEEVAIKNAAYIISEWISDNAYYRKWIRNFVYKNGSITSKLKRGAEDPKKVYEMYYDFTETLKYKKHYRILALNRGEKEKILTVSLDYDKDKIIEFLNKKVIKNESSFVCDIVRDAIVDALKRLILPSIEREIRSEITEESEKKAIETFKSNLEHLLLTRPIKECNVLGFDPAFRTGCKLAVIDTLGNLKDIKVIYPTEPHNDIENSKKVLLELINKYNINLIAIGNGTASRESEKFVAEAIKGTDVKYTIVSEAGASVYSASKLAISEFPDLTVEKRSAISIARRVQDPLSELIKIDPKSIGVGEYQHDVNQKELTESLDFTVSKVVNEVGVNVNTASASLLKFVSGLTKGAINSILKFKEKSKFKNREELKNLKGISAKIYEQAIGFLRIVDGDNLLDKTGIHPESYEITNNLLKELNLNIQDINKKEFKNTLNNIDVSNLASKLNTDVYTLEDIIKELLNPGLDPRDNLDAPILKSDILHIEDLKKGMELQGTVRNVASFGAFIDIGLHNDGLVHISKMSHEFIKNPLDVVNVGDIVTCYVDDIDLEKEKVSLSLI